MTARRMTVTVTISKKGRKSVTYSDSPPKIKMWQNKFKIRNHHRKCFPMMLQFERPMADHHFDTRAQRDHVEKFILDDPQLTPTLTPSPGPKN